jgi:hypothetical protein
LGYIVEAGMGNRKQKEMLRKKARMAMNSIWGIGNRMGKMDVWSDMKLFDCMVKSVMMYGVEIWGWDKNKEMEVIQNKYIKWILSLDANTPSYLITAEMGRVSMEYIALRRAVRYLERVEKMDNKRLPKICWEEIRKCQGKGKETELTKKINGKLREDKCKDWWEEREEKGEDRDREMLEEWLRREMEERDNNIGKSRYCKYYKKIKLNWQSERYLNGRNRRKVQDFAGIRMGNVHRGEKGWLSDNERKCRLCGEEEETMEHIMWECWKGNEDREKLKMIKTREWEMDMMGGDKINEKVVEFVRGWRGRLGGLGE